MLLSLGGSLAPTLVSALLTLAPAGPTLPPGGATGPAPAGPTLGAEAAPATRWVAPVDGALVVLDPFRPPPYDWLPGHRGADLALRPGRAVRAAGDGVVVHAGWLAGRGVVSVEHAGGRRTTYEPVDAIVHEGEHVRAGEVVGLLGGGASHCAEEAPCLHWGLVRDGAYLDPMLLLRQGRPVLLPLAGPTAP